MSGKAATDAERWQRLSVWALPILFLGGLQRFVRENLWLFFGAGAGAAFTERLGLREVGLIALVFVLIAALAGLVYYRRFRFRLEDDALVVRKGLVHREELRLPFERVQNISLSQPVYLRPFDVVRFSAESPGAAASEVELPGIPRPLAETLRERIAAHRSVDAGREDDGEPSAEPAAETELFSAGPAALFLFGVANNQIWVILGVVIAPIANQLERWISRRIEEFVEQLDPAEAELLADAVAPSPVLIALIAGFLLALALLGLLASGVWALVRFHGYQLTRRDQRYRARFGLLDRRERTLSIRKLTSLELVQTGIGRALGRWHLLGHQTGIRTSESLVGRQRFVVPGLDRRRALAVAGEIQPGAGEIPQLKPIAPAYRRVFWLRWTVVLMAAAGALYFFTDTPHGLPAALVASNLPLLGLIHLRWRRWGWRFEDGLVYVRRGLLGQRLAVFDPRRVQSVTVRQSFIERRLDLASLAIRLPHGDVAIPFMDLADARSLANRLVFAVETAAEHGV